MRRWAIEFKEDEQLSRSYLLIFKSQWFWLWWVGPSKVSSINMKERGWMEGEQGSLYVHMFACTSACMCRYRWGRRTCQGSGLWRPEMKLWCLSLGTGLSLCIFWQTGSLSHGIQGSLTQLAGLLTEHLVCYCLSLPSAQRANSQAHSDGLQGSNAHAGQQTVHLMTYPVRPRKILKSLCRSQ